MSVMAAPLCDPANEHTLYGDRRTGGRRYIGDMAELTLEIDGGRVLTLTDEVGRVDRDALWAFLHGSAYWGTWRTRADVEAQVAASWRVVSAHLDDRMVAFARAVSDGVALAYLADVYVVDELRGRGVGVALVRLMIDEGPGASYRWMLHTRDAHGLYARFGFAPPTDTYLERPSSFDPSPAGAALPDGAPAG
jgi:GNAT superfamily N-acetyltransferase